MNDMAAPDDYIDPDWYGARMVHDWKNHVGKLVAEMWDSFSVAQKRAIAIEADRRADEEEWD